LPRGSTPCAISRSRTAIRRLPLLFQCVERKEADSLCRCQATSPSPDPQVVCEILLSSCPPCCDNVFVGESVFIYQHPAGGRIELGDRVHLHNDIIIEIRVGGSLLIGAGTAVQPRCQFEAFTESKSEEGCADRSILRILQFQSMDSMRKSSSAGSRSRQKAESSSRMMRGWGWGSSCWPECGSEGSRNWSWRRRNPRRAGRRDCSGSACSGLQDARVS
jgi:hypothetical protein